LHLNHYALRPNHFASIVTNAWINQNQTAEHSYGDRDSELSNKNRARDPSWRRAAWLRLRGTQTASVESGANDELPVAEYCRHRACGRAGTLLPLALLLCSTFLGHSAIAQTLATPSTPSSSSASGNTDDTLTEIIVTARKQTETIQTIPESITAIDASTLTSSHLTRLDDFNSLVTNLNITQRADNTPDVVMRGVGTFGVVQGVGFYVNDVQQFEGQTVRPVDIERVEVLKGPQGTLFGGSNVGGAIKYVTKAPTDTLTGEGSIEYGRYNQQTVDGVV
jgi:outer membrane receptor for ferric coprogen and ferric-rhodotorulic acid